MKLISQNYGKQHVRVLKVLRDGPRHEVKELEFGVRLEGDIESSYPAGDNIRIVPTDTMKNTVDALTHEHLGLQTKPFTVQLAEHFLTQYPQAGRVTIETTKRCWNRLSVGGQPHDHAFTGSDVRPVVKAVAARGSPTDTQSGIAAAAFDACPEITRIELAMPNKHCLPANLTPFGLDGAGESFVPTDEPHGQIEAVISRDER